MNGTSISAKLRALEGLTPEQRIIATERLSQQVSGSRGDRPNIPALYTKDDGMFVPVDLSTLQEPAPAPMLLGNRIAVGYPNTLYAEGGKGKSLWALAIAFCIALGRRFCGLDLPAGPVLYLDWELSQDGQLRRAYQIARGLGQEKPPKGLYYLAPTDSLPELIDRAAETIQKVKPVLIIVDSMGPASGGKPEDAEDAIGLFNAIRTMGVTSLILDHQSKMQQGQDSRKKTIFGSAYKFNLSRSVLHLEQVSSLNGEIRLILRHTKSNFGPYADDLALVARFTADSVKFEAVDQHVDPAFAAVLTIGEKLLASLRENGVATAEALADRVQEASKTVKNELTRLRKEGKVKAIGKEDRKSVWGLPETSVPTSQLYMAGTPGRSGPNLSSEEIEARVGALPESERDRFYLIHDRLDGPAADPSTIKQQAWEEYQQPC